MLNFLISQLILLNGISNLWKTHILENEINKLEDVVLTDQLAYLNDTKNIRLTLFYFAGMRITDTLLLKWSDFQNGRLFYTMYKNGKEGSFKVPEKALASLKQIKTMKAFMI